MIMYHKTKSGTKGSAVLINRLAKLSHQTHLLFSNHLENLTSSSYHIERARACVHACVCVCVCVCAVFLCEFDLTVAMCSNLDKQHIKEHITIIISSEDMTDPVRISSSEIRR